jgi:dephospho-CoA kinase
MLAQRRLHIGLTGGIGSGKSTVARMLVERGAVLIDTDAIARALALPGGAAIEAIRTQFGASAIDAAGGLDRARMRELVFADAQAKAQLEAILHPMIGLECNRQALAAAGKTTVFDVPLLVESSHWRTRVDRVLVVDCTTETQALRVMNRSGWSREAVLAVIAQQASRERRRACADAVIYNDDGRTLDELARQVDMLLAQWDPVEQSRRSSGARPT